MATDATPGPFVPWCTVADFRCSAATGSPVFTDDEYIDIASSVLYELSGRRFPGIGEKTEWPVSAGGPRSTSVRLDTPWPVTEIDSVYVDGVLVSPLTYVVLDWKFLVRLRDSAGTNPGWPRSQGLDVPEGPGSFRVTYSHGVAVPPFGRFAASGLACSLKAMWCNSPAISPLQAKQQAIRKALDVEEVDAFLRVYPKTVPVGVWTPESDMGMRKTWP